MLVEAVIRATHTGPYRGLPPTGRQWEMSVMAMFVFEQDQLVCERVYFDSNTVLRQLGIARDPLSLTGRLGTVVGHPLTIGRSLVRQLTGADIDRHALGFATARAGSGRRPRGNPGYFSKRERRRSLSTRPPVCSSGQ